MALIPTSVSEPFLYLFGVKNAIFCKFLDKLSALRIASELARGFDFTNLLLLGKASEFTLLSLTRNFDFTNLLLLGKASEFTLLSLTRNFDIQEITLTFRFQCNIGCASG